MLGHALVRTQIACAKKVVPEIVAMLPHDPGAFTQGLAISGGELYESTGIAGQSTLRRLCTNTGAILESIAMPGDVFAEDITALDGKLFQLTYKNGRAFSYQTHPVSLQETFSLPQEGWGLAAWNGGLLASDGSHRLREYSRDMALQETHRASAFLLPLRRINALTIRGHFLLANLWYTHYIAEIHLRNFRLSRVVDCRELIEYEQPESPDHVMNGIAWDRSRNLFWMTGKHWKHLFAARFAELDKVD